MSWYSATVEGKEGNHLVLARNEAIIPQKYSELTQRPNNVKDVTKQGQKLSQNPCFHFPYHLFSTQQPN